MDRGQSVPDRSKRSNRTANLPNKVVPIHEGAEPLRASLDDTELLGPGTRTAVVLATPVRRPPTV
jgi:hypothetical protein